MKQIHLNLLIILMLVATRLSANPLPNSVLSIQINQTFQARRDTIIHFYADQYRKGFVEIAARLYQKRDIEWCMTRLDSLMQNPTGDMFWMFRFVLMQYLAQDVLPDNFLRKMRKMWQTYTPYRGDTENHWIMYYSALYLITQMYPDEPGTLWFNGRSSAENHTEAREFLLHWMHLTTTRGQGEFDSPDYFPFFVIPMAELYAFATDEKMKMRAQMMLDYLIADFAVENLDGLYIGAHSRTYPGPVLNQNVVAATSISWLLFGNTRQYLRGEAAILALSGYVPPQILYFIATDRSIPYVHRELKRTRHRMRYSDVKNAPVYKYSYVCSDYAMGCLQGGLLQPIQQHSWDVIWKSHNSHSKFNTLFTIHPYASHIELGMYFPEEPETLVNIVAQTKSSYCSPDKWTGASPYEQIFQQKNTLIVLYDIPPKTRYPHICTFFPKCLSKREIDPARWIFCVGGQTYIAYYPLAEYEWIEEENNWRLCSKKLKNGAIVQAASAGQFNSFADFKSQIKQLYLDIRLKPKPSVIFQNMGGDRLEFTYDSIPKVNGESINYKNWPLFDSPFLFAKKDSQRLHIKYKQMNRLLDFKKLSITNWIE